MTTPAPAPGVCPILQAHPALYGILHQHLHTHEFAALGTTCHALAAITQTFIDARRPADPAARPLYGYLAVVERLLVLPSRGQDALADACPDVSCALRPAGEPMGARVMLEPVFLTAGCVSLPYPHALHMTYAVDDPPTVTCIDFAFEYGSIAARRIVVDLMRPTPNGTDGAPLRVHLVPVLLPGDRLPRKWVCTLRVNHDEAASVAWFRRMASGMCLAPGIFSKSLPPGLVDAQVARARAASAYYADSLVFLVRRILLPFRIFSVPLILACNCDSVARRVKPSGLFSSRVTQRHPSDRTCLDTTW